ncbi:MAG: winged helix-turn-helix domain-containing protein, partial [Terriglobia bacterium]|nr:winged helix-turn-helix domain-containing protein [Terriglobia bacterium]
MGIDSVSWYEFGPYRLDTEQLLLLRNGEKLPLAPRAVHILKLLLEQQGNVVTKPHLLERVWPDTFVTEGILARHICDLRKGLDGYGAAIETVPRRGYRFTSPAQFRREPGAPIEAPRSVAVLPFRVLRGDHAYLGLGLCDAVITRLGRLRDVEVRPTSAVAAFTSRSAEALEVGLALRVNCVLEGTLRILGTRVRLTLQLVGIPSNTTLWAGKFDCPFDDLFKLEDEVTDQIVAALALNVGGVAQRASRSEPIPNAEAYRLVMQAKYLRSHHAGSQTLRNAVEVLERALTLDPGYAAAYAELAFCYALHPMFGASTPDAVPRAKAAALKALEFEPEQQRARWTLAFIQWHYDFDWRYSEPELRRVLAINPHDADACHTLAMLLAETGRIAEATSTIERAMQLEPTSALVHGSAGMIEYFAGRYQQAVALCRRGLQL